MPGGGRGDRGFSARRRVDARNVWRDCECPAYPPAWISTYFAGPQVQPKADLVFLGSMDWLPNIDGIEYFVREILPLIRKRMPACTLAVVGRTPSAAIRALAERDSGIQVTGTVADVRPWLWGAKVSIVPLRIGGGTRLKIYESMAAGTPTVSTSIGAEGLDVSHPANIRLADTPSAFAEQCVELLENAQERERLAAEALGLVTHTFLGTWSLRSSSACCWPRGVPLSLLSLQYGRAGLQACVQGR